MNRYFKIVEISREEFISITGEDLNGCCQLVVPNEDKVYIGVNDVYKNEIEIDLNMFKNEKWSNLWKEKMKSYI